MAVTTLQVTQTGAAIPVAPAGTFGRWVVFQNNAAHAARVGDANVSATRGYSLAATTGQLPLAPVTNQDGINLGAFSTIGTSGDVLDVIYDSVNVAS